MGTLSFYRLSEKQLPLKSKTCIMNKIAAILVICLSLAYVTEAGFRCSLGQWACDASCATTLRSHGVCHPDGECECQAEVDINNISRCNFGEKACDDFCKLGNHVGGKCNTEENGSKDCECYDNGPRRNDN